MLPDQDNPARRHAEQRSQFQEGWNRLVQSGAVAFCDFVADRKPDVRMRRYDSFDDPALTFNIPRIVFFGNPKLVARNRALPSDIVSETVTRTPFVSIRAPADSIPRLAKTLFIVLGEKSDTQRAYANKKIKEIKVGLLIHFEKVDSSNQEAVIEAIAQGLVEIGTFTFGETRQLLEQFRNR